MRYWLRDKREQAGLTQQELGQMIGKDITTIGKYENGTRTPRPKAAQEIASLLDFDWTDFYKYENPSVNQKRGIVNEAR